MIMEDVSMAFANARATGATLAWSILEAFRAKPRTCNSSASRVLFL